MDYPGKVLIIEEYGLPPHADRDMGIAGYYACQYGNIHMTFTNGEQLIIEPVGPIDDPNSYAVLYIIFRSLGLPWPF